MSEEIKNENVQNSTVRKNNGCAIASFICSLVGLLIAGIPCGIAAVITGIIGIAKISQNKETQKGKWMAIFGIILGSLDILAVAVVLPYIVQTMTELL